MNKQQLIEKLKDIPDDATVILHVNGQDYDLEDIEYIPPKKPKIKLADILKGTKNND